MAERKRVVKKAKPTDAVQGEGDYKSAREFDQQERSFVRSHDTEALGKQAAPEDPAQAEALERAEREGRSHARPDPETHNRNEENEADTGGTDAGKDKAARKRRTLPP
jgi:hypothetical protein